eukprot:TRINITY_DN4056_c0_g1_i2.p1 TRINITY_DN4056_c0_g1~~TRINITY_DN4056_c0_g1_i2.p1  ORF type:complete len:210 (-),score=41.71 TRINITY_DN4056_c0_g1_i2:338-967(-)
MGGFNSKESEDDLPRTSDPPRFIGISSGPFFYSSEPWPTTTETFTTTISVSPSTSLEIDPNAKRDEVPTVITWKGGGKEVFITGSFNGWKEKIPLSKSEHDFTIIQNLPPGVHQYKFIVDGKWRHATDQPIATDVAGNINNCIEVRRETDELQTRVLSSSPPGNICLTLTIAYLLRHNQLQQESTLKTRPKKTTPKNHPRYLLICFERF